MTQPPRDITPAVRRRAWADPLVRFWWLIAAAMFVIALVLVTANYREWAKLRRAIVSGVTAKARIEAAAGDPRSGRAIASTETVGVTFVHAGKTYNNLLGTLGERDPIFRVGEIITVHFDPADPANWTVQSTYPPLGQKMIGPMLVLPVAVICGLIALVGRGKLLKTYARGAAAEATVAANKQTPLAPRSRAIRCSLTSGSRMMEVFVPGGRDLVEGDAVWVILPPGRGRPVAVDWFADPTGA